MSCDIYTYCFCLFFTWCIHPDPLANIESTEIGPLWLPWTPLYEKKINSSSNLVNDIYEAAQEIKLR